MSARTQRTETVRENRYIRVLKRVNSKATSVITKRCIVCDTPIDGGGATGIQTHLMSSPACRETLLKRLEGEA